MSGRERVNIISSQVELRRVNGYMIVLIHNSKKVNRHIEKDNDFIKCDII